MIPHLAVLFGSIALAVAFSISASIAFADGQKPAPVTPTTLPVPGPDLSPKAVVKIVVDALRKNDAQDTGIKTTFKFASPANQQITGPVERFIPMLKGPMYAPMINSRSVDVHELKVDQDAAAELAIIVDANGDKAFYIFQLTRQSDGDLKNCWMTDGVMRVEPADGPADQVPEKPKDKPVQKLPDGQFPA